MAHDTTSIEIEMESFAFIDDEAESSCSKSKSCGDVEEQEVCEHMGKQEEQRFVQQGSVSDWFIDLKTKLQKPKAKHQKKLHMAILWASVGMSICLSAADVITDVILALKYHRNGDWWWFLLTTIFCSAPFAIVAIVAPLWVIHRIWILRQIQTNANTNTSTNKTILEKLQQGSTLWSAYEVLFESGPQLLLQMYILAQPTGTSIAPGSLINVF